jgi:hypothetical protein
MVHGKLIDYTKNRSAKFGSCPAAVTIAPNSNLSPRPQLRRSLSPRKPHDTIPSFLYLGHELKDRVTEGTSEQFGGDEGVLVDFFIKKVHRSKERDSGEQDLNKSDSHLDYSERPAFPHAGLLKAQSLQGKSLNEIIHGDDQI